jgi:sulfite exporter TauE/SafE
MTTAKPYRGNRPGPDSGDLPKESGKDWVAIILAIGLATSMNIFIIGVWVDDVKVGRPLSQQSSEVLLTVFGGIIGVLGSYVGYRAGSGTEQRRQRMRAEARAEGKAEAEQP